MDLFFFCLTIFFICFFKLFFCCWNFWENDKTRKTYSDLSNFVHVIAWVIVDQTIFFSLFFFLYLSFYSFFFLFKKFNFFFRIFLRFKFQLLNTVYTGFFSNNFYSLILQFFCLNTKHQISIYIYIYYTYSSNTMCRRVKLVTLCV